MPGSIVPLPVMLEDEQDRKAYEQLEAPKAIVVRYGYMKMIAELPYDGDAKPGCGSKLVIRSPRGNELATMLTTTCPNAGCGNAVSRKQMLQYVENSGGKDYPFTTQGKILRVATVDDLNEQARLDAKAPETRRIAQRMIREMDLPMKLVEVEQLLGGERIIFHYTAEQWVDFRELVRHLAGEFQTRIEMHQVNARDEARIVADYEKCGQHCCCKQFLKVLKPVSMRNAKIQKATLDPTKISGRCGRLMCCLRYEEESYDSLRKRLPNRNSRVMTPDGPGTVLDSQILTQLVLIQVDTQVKPAAYPVENITVMTKQEQAEHPRPEARFPDGGGRPQRGERRPRSGEGRGDAPREPRRPKPGEPLRDEESQEAGPEVEADQVSSEQDDSEGPSGTGDDAQPPFGDADDIETQGDGTVGESEAVQGESRSRKRRRRRRRRRGGSGPGGSNPGGSDQGSSGPGGPGPGGTGSGGGEPSE
ncbi:MAG: hypothetical protein GC164_13115 [Phycisphaera sp.]|nr:hypothetical protein [Phycisphaera sp.]